MTDANASAPRSAVTRRRVLAILASAFSVPYWSRVEATETQSPLKNGLEALAKRQNQDGSFGGTSELFGRDPGVAALCGLAFLASENAGRCNLRRGIDLVVDFLLSRSHVVSNGTSFVDLDPRLQDAADAYLAENSLKPRDVDGLIADFGERGRKPAYGHALATLFLSEALGTIRRPELRDRVKAAVRLVERAQNSEGGWRYDPFPVVAADLSVTTCQLAALRAAENAGIMVDANVVERGLDFVKSLQNADGGFRYMATDGASGYGRTAAAICALQSGGEDGSEEIEKGFQYLEQYENDAEAFAKIEYRRYAQFHASLAYWRAATTAKGQKRWQNFFARLTAELDSLPAAESLWRTKSAASAEADAAFAICALEIPNERIAFFLR